MIAQTSIDLLQLVGDSGLKRVVATNGGEWAGACPFCGGRDRFRVWPEQRREGGAGVSGGAGGEH